MSLAHTLESAYSELDPKPLSVGQLDTLFVFRPNSRTSQFINELSYARSGEKFIFIGHRGSGKSTELGYVAKQLEAKYYTISVPVFEVFQSASLSHDELMFALFSRILRTATDEKLVRAGIVTEAWNKYLRGAFENLGRVLFGAATVSLTGNDLSAKINLQLAEIELNVANDPDLIGRLKGRASEFQRYINTTIDQIRKVAKREVLLIIEDLDKFDLEHIQRLFVDHAGTLQLPSPTTIYTFPVAMRYSDDFDQIRQAFKPYALPNIGTCLRSGEPDGEGRSALREIITRRAHESLFSPEALDRIVMCGGIVRDTILLAQDSINNALAARARRVELTHVEEAFNEVSFVRQSTLTSADYRDLPAYRRAELRNSPDVQRWLKNGCLIEYRNHVGIWCDLSPAADEVIRRNERSQKPARRARKSR